MSAPFVAASLAWLVAFLIVRRAVARWAWNDDPSLLWPLVALAIAAAVALRLARPATGRGKASLVPPALTLIGLLLVQAGLWCCPGGHPPLGGLLWAGGGLLALLLMIVQWALLAASVRQSESSRFLRLQAALALPLYALATALVPLPV